MKILIIGNKGFIGGHLSKALLEAGHQLTGLDIAARDDNDMGYLSYKGDIMNPGDVKKAAEGAQLVINLAAKHHDFGIKREEFFLINEDGTRNCLKCLSDLGIKRFIFYSSVAVYGYRDDCTSEGTPLNPGNDYGESKLAAERVIEAWIKEDPARSAIVIRPTVVFGPNNWANMYKLINAIYRKAYVQVGKGDQIKSLAYVENLVDATLFLMDKEKEGLNIYNYSDYDHLKSIEIVNIIRGCLSRRPVRSHLPLGPIVAVTGIIDVIAKITGINFHITANRIKKLNTKTMHGSDKLRDLGFKQRITIKEGLRRMVAWYLDHGKYHVEKSR